MKFRIKDTKLRAAAITLFGDLAKEFDYGSNLTAIEVSFAPLHSINNELSCIFHPLTNELEIEPVKELAEGWHPYPDEKPEKEDLYLTVFRFKGEDGRAFQTFENGKFRSIDTEVFAWREFPKIWQDGSSINPESERLARAGKLAREILSDFPKPQKSVIETYEETARKIAETPMWPLETKK